MPFRDLGLSFGSYGLYACPVVVEDSLEILLRRHGALHMVDDELELIDDCDRVGDGDGPVVDDV